jgi:hypothetical protein
VVIVVAVPVPLLTVVDAVVRVFPPAVVWLVVVGVVAIGYVKLLFLEVCQLDGFL